MEVNIFKFDHFGRGIGKINEKIVFVERALPRERIDTIITNEKKNYLEGKINKIFKESEKRIKPICPYYDKCGGCNFLHTTYEVEKEYKITKGKELLGQVDEFYETKNLNYRNKVTLHVVDNKIGLFEEKSNKIVEIDYCYLLDDNINRVIKNLKEMDLSLYSINQVIIKANNGKILLEVDSSIDEEFIKNFHYVDTIISNKNIVKGNGFIEDVIDNKRFKITSKAFFQVNKEGLENISKIIKDFLKERNINEALDLYSGTSLWGIIISNYVKHVTSIEINREACLNAKDNIKNNNITNIQVINGDVADYIDQFNNIDLVIIDPPRSGLDKKTREYFRRINSKFIIYISCDMQTLQRDLKELKQDYDTLKISLVDMFKRTYHVETVCLLCRKTIDK